MDATSQLICQTSDQAQAAVCAKLNSWPPGPAIYSGAVAPDGNQYGYWPGDIYLNTESSQASIFNGTPGTNTGWVDFTMD